MFIIKIIANENGSRPPIQTWNGENPPAGYAVCPDEFYTLFYSTSPAGFVNITVENGVVTEMTVNQAALNEYIANLPEEPATDKTPTIDERVKALEKALAQFTGGENI
jgi:hypothetical protein